MIKYALRCIEGHEFEGWFSANADFENQRDAGLIACPHCGSQNVSKGLMAPSVSTARAKENKSQTIAAAAPAEALNALREAVAAIRGSCEDVGERFPEEARKIHYGETEARGILGSASAEAVGSLLEEGINIMPIPALPEDAN